MTYIHWSILTLIHGGVVHTAADIAKELAYDSGALTRVLDQLEEAGHIQRRRSCQDRRLVFLVLTDKGLEIARILAAAVTEYSNKLFSIFTSDEVYVLQALLQKFISTINECPIDPQQ